MPDQATGQTPEMTKATGASTTTVTGTTMGQPPAGGDERDTLLTADALDELTAKVSSDPAKAAKTIKRLRTEAAERRRMAEELTTLKQQAEAEAETKRKAEEAALAEQGRWKEVAEARERDQATLKALVDRLTPYEAAIKEALERKKAAIPEALRKRIPDYGDPIRELQYIDANPDLFTETRTAPNLNQGQGKTDGNPADAATRDQLSRLLRSTFGGR